MDLEPFEALPIARIVSRNEIIRVHVGVHKQIGIAEERTVAARFHQQRNVRAQANGHVMVHVQHGDLAEFLAQHEQQRLDQIEDLVQEVDICSSSGLFCGRQTHAGVVAVQDHADVSLEV